QAQVGAGPELEAVPSTCSIELRFVIVDDLRVDAVLARRLLKLTKAKARRALVRADPWLTRQVATGRRVGFVASGVLGPAAGPAGALGRFVFADEIRPRVLLAASERGVPGSARTESLHHHCCGVLHSRVGAAARVTGAGGIDHT